MNKDAYGLPIQANGDANDQLNRVGLITVGGILRPLGIPDAIHSDVVADCHLALYGLLQVKPGIYIRHTSGSTDNVSADQLLPVLAAWIVLGERKQAAWMFIRMLGRLGFAQNTRDGIGGDDAKWKVPDFMLLRALPLFARAHWLLYPLACVFDLLLVIAALASCGPVWRDGQGFTKRSPADVDDGVIICTLATCRAVMPTPLSALSIRLYAKCRQVNNGNLVMGETNRVMGSLVWYHRAAAQGNPEIAELYRPIIERWFS